MYTIFQVRLFRGSAVDVFAALDSDSKGSRVWFLMNSQYKWNPSFAWATLRRGGGGLRVKTFPKNKYRLYNLQYSSFLNNHNIIKKLN